MSSLHLLLLSSLLCGVNSSPMDRDPDLLQSGANRQPRWFLDRISNYIPSGESISNRVSQTFSSSSMSQAAEVLSPLRSYSPSICQTTDDSVFRQGLCVRLADCPYYSGTSYGSCAAGLGSCCVFDRTCDSTSESYITQFTSPRYPAATASEDTCKLTVKPMTENICQYRIDFEDFSILGPDDTSDCTTDFLSIAGGSAVPKICGDMTGQHIYVNVKPGYGSLELTVDFDVTQIASRKWNMKITQIPCGSPTAAPPGCLQFHNETSGTVRSFNFKNSLPDVKQGLGGQIHNQQYGVCINSKLGYCELTWTAASGNNTFSVTGNSSLNSSQHIALYGTAECNEDYVSIFGGEFEDRGEVRREDRLCGTKFPKQVKTRSQPYRLYVKTDNSEENDFANTGFALNFRHNLC